MLNCFQTGAGKAINFVAADADLEEITLNNCKNERSCASGRLTAGRGHCGQLQMNIFMCRRRYFFDATKKDGDMILK